MGDPFGTWDRDPDDPTQFCHARLVESPRVGASGYSLQLDYDVDSPNPAYNGLWVKLPGVLLRRYEALELVVKGNAAKGFTRRLKVELKDGRRHVADYVLDGIGSEWIRMRIPLHVFRSIEKLSTATEFVVVFDDQTVTQLVGTLYLGEIAFTPAA